MQLITAEPKLSKLRQNYDKIKTICTNVQVFLESSFYNPHFIFHYIPDTRYIYYILYISFLTYLMLNNFRFSKVDRKTNAAGLTARDLSNFYMDSTISLNREYCFVCIIYIDFTRLISVIFIWSQDMYKKYVILYLESLNRRLYSLDFFSLYQISK